MNWFLVADLMILLVAACRVTRIFTADTLTLDLRENAEKQADWGTDWRWVWFYRLITCPFCIGLYVCIVGVLSLVAVRDWWPDSPVEWWRLLAAPFVLNYIQAHINARLDP